MECEGGRGRWSLYRGCSWVECVRGWVELGCYDLYRILIFIIPIVPQFIPPLLPRGSFWRRSGPPGPFGTAAGPSAAPHGPGRLLRHGDRRRRPSGPPPKLSEGGGCTPDIRPCLIKGRGGRCPRHPLPTIVGTDLERNNPCGKEGGGSRLPSPLGIMRDDPLVTLPPERSFPSTPCPPYRFWHPYTRPLIPVTRWSIHHSHAPVFTTTASHNRTLYTNPGHHNP